MRPLPFHPFAIMWMGGVEARFRPFLQTMFVVLLESGRAIPTLLYLLRAACKHGSHAECRRLSVPAVESLAGPLTDTRWLERPPRSNYRPRMAGSAPTEQLQTRAGTAGTALTEELQIWDGWSGTHGATADPRNGPHRGTTDLGWLERTLCNTAYIDVSTAPPGDHRLLTLHALGPCKCDGTAPAARGRIIHGLWHGCAASVWEFASPLAEY